MNKKKVNTQPLLQLEAVECGAASLGIICSHYGLYLPLEQLRVDCAVSRDGSNALHIVKAAENYGLIAKGMRKTKGQVLQLSFPFIVFWEQNHFLVVEGASEKKVYLNDPALGKWWVTHEEFAKYYSGIVLTFEPGKNFKKGGHPFRLMPHLRTLLGRSKKTVLLLLFTALLTLVPALILPSITRVFVDYILIHRHYSWYMPVLVALFSAVALSVVLTKIQQKIIQRLAMKLSVTLTYRLIVRIFSLPYSFYLQRSKAEVATRIDYATRIAETVSGPLLQTAFGLATAAFFFFVMLTYSISLSFVALFLSLTSLTVMYFIGKNTSVLFNRFVKESSSLSALNYNGFYAMESIKSSSGENAFFQKWTGLHARYLQSAHLTQIKTSTGKAIPILLNALTTAALLLLGGMEVMKGTLSVGMLITFTVFFQFFTAPLQRLAENASELQLVAGYFRSINDILNYPVKIPEKTRPVPDPDQPLLTINKISFGYNHAQPPILTNISLTIEPGSRIAFIGLSGSGKSTLAKLVCGMYEPWSGNIAINNVPMPDIDPSQRAAVMGVVDQEVELFAGKIRDVLTFWDESIPDEQIIQACKLAEIHTVISARPGGYYSELEEGGRNFSGGERQRMEIARALLRNPSILIMDEATSALDPETEFRICNNIRSLGITLITIAHRLSVVKDADLIIVLDKGHITDSGNHQQLKETSPLYKEFLKSSQ